MSGDAEYYQDHKDDERDWGAPQRGEPGKRLTTVVSVRLTPDQEERLRAAAQRMGQSISSFIRETAVHAAGVMIVASGVTVGTATSSSTTVTVGNVELAIPPNQVTVAA